MSCNLIIFSTNPYVSQAKTAEPTFNLCVICKARNMGKGCKGKEEVPEAV